VSVTPHVNLPVRPSAGPDQDAATGRQAPPRGPAKRPRPAAGAGGGPDHGPEDAKLGQKNNILGALAPAAYARIEPDLKTVVLPHGEVISEADTPIEYVYFPETAVFSMVRHMTNGAGVEVGTIGFDGAVGGSILSGAITLSARCVIQVAGHAKRMTSTALLEAVAADAGHNHNHKGHPPNLATLINRYSQALFEQVAQSAACNRLHALEQRCARWLLMTHDRVEGDEIPLTQEFLSYMLGVRRAGVTEACGTLQRSGLIRYRHGHISIIDRSGLEAAACECYGVAATAYTVLMGPLLAGAGEH